MILRFEQRLFSWFDSYDIYDENGNIAFVVKGKPAWGHMFKIYNQDNEELGSVTQEVLTLLPKFYMHELGTYIGKIEKRFTFFSNEYDIDYFGWYIEGGWTGWNYTIYDEHREVVANIEKQLLNLVDTYILDITNESEALYVLMIVLAIDAEKCSKSNSH